MTAEECECRYSLAKRRGPAPGSKNEKRRSEEVDGVLHSKKKRRRKEEKQLQQMLMNGNGGGNPMGGLFGNFQGNPMGGFGASIPLPLDPGAAGEIYWFILRFHGVVLDCC